MAFGILRRVWGEEPLWVDLRQASESAQLSLRSAPFREEMGGLLAALTGRAKADLLGDDVRVHQRARRVVAAVVAALPFCVLGAWLYTLLSGRGAASPKTRP